MRARGFSFLAARAAPVAMENIAVAAAVASISSPAFSGAEDPALPVAAAAACRILWRWTDSAIGTAIDTPMDLDAAHDILHGT